MISIISDVRKAVFSLLLAIMIISAQSLKSQTFAEVDFMVTNKLYDFLIEYEKSICAEDYSIKNMEKFFYNSEVEVFNDLSAELPAYIPISKYLFTLDTIKEKNPAFEIYHFNLKLIKQLNGSYFDIVHIRLLREIVDNSKLKEKSIKNTNKLSSQELDFTLLFNKFENDGTFKIMKIEKAEESMLPDAWHRKSIPDEVKISFGPSFLAFKNISDELITTSNNHGFDGAVSIHNRFAGGKNFALSWFAGIGITNIRSEWNMQYDSIEIADAIDNFEDSYTRRIISNGIQQDVNLLYLKAPIGASFRLFNQEGISLTFSGEIAPSYLVNSTYKTTDGNITYSGIYYQNVNGQTYPFHLTNIGRETNDYDFYTNTATTNDEGIRLDKFGGTAGFSIQASYTIAKHFEVFIAPSWRWGLNNLLSDDAQNSHLSINNWEANPIIEQVNNPSFSSTTVEAGFIFKLNNVAKPFIKETKFKNNERGHQKENFENYLANQIPYDPPKYADPEKKKIILSKAIPDVNYPNRIKYAFHKEIGIEKGALKTGKINTIKKIPYKGLFLFKPYGFDIRKMVYQHDYNAYQKILVDSLHTDTVKFEISHLPDLNINVIMKMNDPDKTGVRDRIINNYKKNIKNHEGEKCALYFYETHGNNINGLFEESDKDNWCFSCNDFQNSFDTLEKKTVEIGEPNFNFINELRILLKNDFTLERRNINLNIYSGNSNAFFSAFNSLQNLDLVNTLGKEDWSSKSDSYGKHKDRETLRGILIANPVKVNQFKNISFYYDNEEEELTRKIADFYYTKRIVELNDPFIKNTYKVLYQYMISDGQGNKSIRLRNFEFKKL